MAEQLFKLESGNIFRWEDVETCLIKGQYNEMLGVVLKEYYKQYDFPPIESPPNPQTPSVPNFLNSNYCLTIDSCRKTPVGVPA